MSKRRQGKAKGGRAARHHEPQGLAPPPVQRRRRYSVGGRDLLADGQAAVEEYFARKHRREEMAKLGYIEEKLSPEEMMAALGLAPPAPDGEPEPELTGELEEAE